MLFLKVKKYHVSMKQEEGRVVEHVVVRSGNDDGGRSQGDKKMRDTGTNSNKDQGSGGQQQEDQEQKGRHPHKALKTTPITTTTVNNQSTSKRTTERIKAKVSSLAAAAAASLPKARKVIKSNKSIKPRKPAIKAKHPNEVKNQRGGFKSTQERKQAQLIPVLDEHGATIEDHFISPRDSDGDGVPDYFILLRPSSDNGKDMMDLGLFDEEVVAPVPAPASAVAAVALPSVVPTTVPPPVAPSQAPATGPGLGVVPSAVKLEAASTTNPSASVPTVIADAAGSDPLVEWAMSSSRSPPSTLAPIDS